MTSPLTLPAVSAAVIAGEVAAWGARRVETGGFMLAGDDAVISHVALSGARGISRRRDQFVVSGRAIATLFAYASERNLRVRAQFHSHGGSAFLSRTDLNHGFSVDGFVTTVIPSYADPPPSTESWGWWCFAESWVEISTPPQIGGDVHVLRFDEDGVRAS